MKEKAKKDKFIGVLPVIFLIAGLSLLLYPTISNWWNNRLQGQVIVEYEDKIAEFDEETASAMREEAHEYNRRLASGVRVEELRKDYYDVLDPYDTGYMGYLEIPAISAKLPIAHGTDDAVLEKAVGHLDWTSLPVGGESTHSVLSGHSGLVSAEILTNLSLLEIGDRFYVHVLDEALEYEVDAINVVLPDETDLLTIHRGEDYVTLVTCTPYGINSHRLLVRGVRMDDAAEDGSKGVLDIRNEAEPISFVVLLPMGLAVVWILTYLLMRIERIIRKVRKNEKHHQETE